MDPGAGWRARNYGVIVAGFLQTSRNMKVAEELGNRPTANARRAEARLGCGDCGFVCVAFGRKEETKYGLPEAGACPDVGSVSVSVHDQMQRNCVKCAFIPAHPVAGTGKSGPDAGFGKHGLTIVGAALTAGCGHRIQDALDRLIDFFEGFVA